MDERTSEERLLMRAAAATAYPATPQLRARVLAAIASPGGARPPSGRRWRLLAATAASIAAVALAVVLALPASRSAVAEFFGVRGSHIAVLPTPAAGVTPTPLSTPVGLEQAAQAITSLQADAALGFAPPRPAGAGEPRAIYFIRYFNAVPVVILQYGPYDLWVLKPDDGGIFVKGGEPGITLDTPLVHGAAANWLSDGTHIVSYTDASGQPAAGSQRTVTRNTLVWRTGTAFYRLETDLDEQAAVALAKTLP